MDPRLGIRFWGTRGLISSPSIDKAIFGGNTTCAQILQPDQTIIVDTGFGVTNLGESLMKLRSSSKQSIECHIFFTHFHWDHIQGLPFFSPIYFPDTKINLYSPVAHQVMKENLDLLFDGSYSPFSGIDSMPAQITFHQVTGSEQLGGLNVQTQAVDHGDEFGEDHHAPTYAYRFECDRSRQSITLVTDHEGRGSVINQEVVAFAENTDILVHDAQYSEEEYRAHVGWGHSSFTHALDNALASRSEQCLLTHHLPNRTDAELQDHIRRLYMIPKYHSLKFDFARENEDIYCETTIGKSKQKVS